MARAKNFMQVTGSMAKISMYTMQGHDEVIVRTKGGPTKRQIKTKPQFEKVRRNNSEWAGCTKMGSRIRQAYSLMNRLEDYPASGALNAICKQIQKMDTESEHGQRRVLLSQHKDMLGGFSLSRKQVFESVLRVPVIAGIDRAAGLATVEIPAINTDLYLYNFRKLPYYRIVANFGGVSDMIFTDTSHGEYVPSQERYFYSKKGFFESDWFPATGIQPGISFDMNYPLVENPIPDDVTLILTLGIEFGQIGYGNTIEPVKYSGTGKMMKVV